MAKLTLSDIANLQNEATVVSTLASNNTATTNALENTLSLDGTSPNSMTANLDLNNNYIINLHDPTSNQHAVTKAYGDAHYGDSLTSANAAAASAAAASSSASSASTSASNASTSATNAATSATNASTSATNASNSATSAATSATNAAASAGVIGAQWTFDTTTTMADPGTGKLRFNNATVASVTAVAVSDADAESGNPNIKNYILTWDDSTNTTKGYLVLRKLGTPSTYAIFSVTGSVTDNTTWAQIPVTYVGSNGTWSLSDTAVVGFTRAGDKGVDGAMTGPGVSVDSEIALFSGVSGTSLKRATQTGILKATSGVIGTATSGTDYAPATSGSSILKGNGSGGFSNAVSGTDYQAADAQLFSNIPQNSQSAAYTLVLTDGEKHIYHPSADTTARVWTIPANASVAYPVGTAITFVNDTSAGALTISITTDTLMWAGSGLTGSRTLAAGGMATILKITSTKWIISGTGLT